MRFSLTLGCKFHIFPYNSKITLPRENNITTKNVTNEISDDFCLICYTCIRSQRLRKRTRSCAHCVISYSEIYLYRKNKEKFHEQVFMTENTWKICDAKKNFFGQNMSVIQFCTILLLIIFCVMLIWDSKKLLHVTELRISLKS